MNRTSLPEIRRWFVTVMALVSALGCSGKQEASSAASSTPSTPRQMRFYLTEGPPFPAMANLSDERRAEIAKIQAILKPQYRDALRYTFSANGLFIVMLNGIVVNYCHTPASGPCRHDCGMGWEEQTWEAVPMMETGRCQDGSRIWLHPTEPLPQFEPA